VSGFSARASKTTCGKKYRRATDANYMNAKAVAAAADEALKRRGLFNRKRVSPSQAAGNALVAQQALGWRTS
jgi:hypothetical protein